MPASESASNIFDAIPGLDSIPAPTIETFETDVSDLTSWKLRLSLRSLITATAASASLWGTVKVISFVPSRPIDCKIISTLILACETLLKI